MSGSQRRRVVVLASVMVTLAVVVPAQAANEQPWYVSLGDSYSSGEGVPPFEPNSDMDGNRCHRSTQAYPAQFAAGPKGRGFHRTSFACSGATTDDFFHGGRAADTPDGQIARVPRFTKMVTLTVGGDDLGFSRVMAACTFGDCTTDPEWKDLDQRIDALAPKLRSVYDRLRKTAPEARVFVLGYPAFLTNVGQVRPCNDDPGLSKEEKNWLNGHLTHLNRVINDQASGAGATYVNVEKAFHNHEVCTPDPWSIGWDKDHLGWSYHPNVKGHRALTTALARVA